MSELRLVLAFSAIFAASCARSSAPPHSSAPAPPMPELGRLGDEARPIAYRVELTIVPSEPRYSGKVSIEIELAQPTRSFWINARDLSVRRAVIAPDLRSSITQDESGFAEVTVERDIPIGRAVLEVEYDAEFDHSADAVFTRSEDGESYAFTQFEATMARRAFPCFDEPRFKTPFELSLVVKSDHTAVANTRLIEEVPMPNGMKRLRFARTEPLPTYLLAFGVGPLEIVPAPDVAPNAIRSRPLPLRGVAIKGKGRRLSWALAHAPKIVEILEQLVGTPFPFEKLDLIAVPGFPGAMENVGAIMFNEYSVMLDEGHASAAQQRSFGSLVAHEVGHHWFGNSVTMPWWDDLWLNEAFASWCEPRVLERFAPEHRAELDEILDMQDAIAADSLVSARRIREPIRSSDDIVNAFDDITYLKGAAVLAMFERYVGQDVFRAAIKRYLEAHRFGTATADDFLAALSLEARADLGAAFKSFLEQPGVPYVGARLACTGDHAELELVQERYLPAGSRGDRNALWHIPLCVSFPIAGKIERRCHVFSSARELIPLGDRGCPAWVIPNADGSGYFRWSLPKEGHRALAKARDALSTREQLSHTDAIDAGLGSGRLSFEEAMELLEPLARSPERRLARKPMELIARAREQLLDPDDLPRLEAYARRLFEGGLEKARIAASSDLEKRLFVRDLTAFLAIVARDRSVREDLARSGRRYLGFDQDRTIHPEALESDLVPIALRVTAEEGGPEVFRHLVGLFFSTKDALLHRQLADVIGSVSRPDLASSARAVLLAPETSNDDFFQLLYPHLGSKENRRPAWEWLKKSFDEIRKKVSEELVVEVLGIPASLCTSEDLAEVKREAERLGSLPGGQRRIEEAAEAIDLCASAAARQKESARAFFARTRD
jgi:cytosol alanyl aminopeptidase